MVYAVYTTESFEREVDKLSESEKKVIKKIFLRLKENPYVGDPIRYKFFREKRIKEKRIYYLIYDDLSAVLIVAFGGKKAQQDTIDKIIKDFPKFKEYMKNSLKENNF